MKCKYIFRLIQIIPFIVSSEISADAIKINYQVYTNKNVSATSKKQTGFFDCVKHDPCQIPFRADYQEYLDLKYNHKRKLIYKMDNNGYYYYTYNPKRGKDTAFDLMIRVYFNQVVIGNTIVDIGIDTATQSGQVYTTNSGSEKQNWKYLIPETPTLSPIVNGGQVFVVADHPVDGGKLYSINAKTGKLEWFFLTPGAILMYPVLYEKSIILVDDSGNIFWVDRETGLMQFKYIMEEFPVTNPILKDKILYFAGRRGHIYAIKLYDATTVWKDLSLIGDVTKMLPQNKGFLLHGANHYWLFNYINGAKQDKIDNFNSLE
jgi:hypothetical protein